MLYTAGHGLKSVSPEALAEFMVDAIGKAGTLRNLKEIHIVIFHKQTELMQPIIHGLHKHVKNAKDGSGSGQGLGAYLVQGKFSCFSCLTKDQVLSKAGVVFLKPCKINFNLNRTKGRNM